LNELCCVQKVKVFKGISIMRGFGVSQML